MSNATTPKGRVSHRSTGVGRYRKELGKMIKNSERELKREVRIAISRARHDHAHGGEGVAIIQEGGLHGRKPWARILIGNCTRDVVDDKIRALLPEGWSLEASPGHRARRELTDWLIVGHFPAEPIE